MFLCFYKYANQTDIRVEANFATTYLCDMCMACSISIWCIFNYTVNASSIIMKLF